MYFVFDIGGTNTRVGVSRDGKTIAENATVPTPQNFEKGMTEIIALANKLGGGENFQAAAGGVAGPLDKDHAVPVNAPHLQDWIKKPLKQKLEAALGVSVYLENDSALVGLGEACSGAGKGSKIVAYIGVGTGLGGARIVEGKIDMSASGFEPGHQILGIGPEALRLEEYVSGSAFERRYGKKAAEITNPEIWEEAELILAYGLHNTIAHWSPNVLVLGGSMIIGNPLISLEKVENHLNQITNIFTALPTIKKAELGAVGGLYGALEHLGQQI